MGRTVKIFLFNNHSLIADRCVVGDSFRVRFIGLMGKKKLSQGEALWLPGCTSIHMWFMKISIDVLFLKKIKQKNQSEKNLYKVPSLYENVKPWKIFPVSDFFFKWCN